MGDDQSKKEEKLELVNYRDGEYKSSPDPDGQDPIINNDNNDRAYASNVPLNQRGGNHKGKASLGNQYTTARGESGREGQRL